MSRKSRYLLIAACFIIFFALAPIVVLYVKGIIFDFDNKQFVETGTLAVKSEPKSVEVFLDGELKKKEAGNIKFLKPKEYQLELKKDGYFSWNKRLNINSGQVVWAQSGAEKIYLLKRDQTPHKISENVLDFIINGDALWFLTPDAINFTNADGRDKITSYNLPIGADVIAADYQSRIFLLKNSGDPKIQILFNAEQATSTGLSALFPEGAEFRFQADGQLLALENQNLYRINFSNYQADSKILILEGLLAFTTTEDSLYYIRPSDNGNTLYTAKFPYASEFKLSEALPDFQTAEIIINYNKGIFLSADGELYRITDKATRLSTDLGSWNFAENQNSIIFTAAGELKQFNYSENKEPVLITRTQKNLSSPVLRKNINYAFAALDNNITAMELDTRDHQNEHNLYTAAGLKKIDADSAGKKIIFLGRDGLFELEIR